MKYLVLLVLIGFAAAADYTPLTPDEYAFVKGAWDKVKHNEIEILYTIFKEYPDIQSKFTQFANKDLEELKGAPQFALHATRIVSFLSQIVALSSNKANVPAVTELVEEFGLNHHGRGVTKDQLNEFRTALTKYVSTHAPWGDNIASAWDKAFDNMFTIAFSKL